MTSSFPHTTIAAKVQRVLAQRRPGFELDDGDIAVEHGLTRRQVNMNLEPAIKEGFLALRVENGISHYRLPGSSAPNAAPATPLPAPANQTPAQAKKPRAPTVAPPDPAAFTPKPFTAVPEPERGLARTVKYIAVINKLKPGTMVDGLSAAWQSSIRKLVSERHDKTRERYAMRRPIGAATFALYRLADEPAPKKHAGNGKAKP